MSELQCITRCKIHPDRFRIVLLGALAVATIIFMTAQPSTASDEAPAYGPEMEGFSYPWPVLGKEDASRIPHVQLVEYPDLGHSPQIQAPEVFHKALLDWLNKN